MALVILLVVIALLPALMVALALSVPRLPHARMRKRQLRFPHRDRPTAA